MSSSSGPVPETGTCTGGRFTSSATATTSKATADRRSGALVWPGNAGDRPLDTGASAGRVPVVPVVIRGSRAMLSADMRLPRRSPLEVLVKPPLHADGPDDAPAALRRSSRASILADLPEPDLVGQES